MFPSLDSIAGTGKYSAVGTVLVIPAAETQVGELATIMEDMNIMSRIFDKELGETNMILGGGFSRRRGPRPTPETGSPRETRAWCRAAA